MTEETKNEKKIRRIRKRVYETVEPASAPEMVAAAEVLIEAPAPAKDAVQAVEESVDQTAGHQAKAAAIVRRYVLWSAGAGVLPVPIFDMLSLLALQMLMVRKLAGLYDIPYSEQRAKAAVAGLLSGATSGYVGGGALKMLPFFGIISLAVMPSMNAALSYAVGKVFIQHFESGGTFLDFDPEKVRAYFEKEFQEGKLKAQ